MKEYQFSKSVSRRETLRVIGMGCLVPATLVACTPSGGGTKAAAPKSDGHGEAAKKAEHKASAGHEEAPKAPASAPNKEAASAPAKPAEAPASKPAAAKPEAAAAEPAKTAAATGGGDCTAGAEIEAASKQMRTALKYVPKSSKAGQACSSCLQWIPGKGNANCGGCKLFSGPVNAGGYCLSYAPAS